MKRRPAEGRSERAIRKYWLRPEPPTKLRCDHCSYVAEMTSGVAMPGVSFTDLNKCPQCHVGTCYFTATMTAGRDARADITTLLGELALLRDRLKEALTVRFESNRSVDEK